MEVRFFTLHVSAFHENPCVIRAAAGCLLTAATRVSSLCWQKATLLLENGREGFCLNS